MPELILDETCVILDTETTGLPGKSQSEICDIAIINYQGNTIFNSLVKPIHPIPEELTKIHGITDGMVADAPFFYQIHNKLIETLSNKKIIIYNARFDLSMLGQSARIANIDPSFYLKLCKESICAMLWYSVYRKEPGKYDGYKWHKLTDAAAYENVDVSDLTAHRALADCLITLRLINTVNNKLTEDTMNGLISIQDKLTYTPMAIEFDADYYKSWARDITAKYTGLIVTEDIEASIRKEIAQLNKFEKELSANRIDIVKKISAPITDFETQVKDVVSIIKDTALKLKEQCDVFENERRAQKAKGVQDVIDRVLASSDLEDKYKVQLTILDRYLNKTETMPKVIADIQARYANLQEQQKNELMAKELERQKEENRELLVTNLNGRFNFDVRPSQVKHLTDEELEDYYVKRDAKRTADKIMQEKLIVEKSAIEKQAEEMAKPCQFVTTSPIVDVHSATMIYKDVRIGGANQGVILKAIAQLKASGFDVQFI